MKVFISWSGERSHAVAEALRDWLPCVIQFADPFISSVDIHKGKRWFEVIGRNLQDSAFGVLCVTPENQGAPWLNYEAGALAARFDEANVAPVLLDLEPPQLVGPMTAFNASRVRDEGEVKKLVSAMNLSGAAPLADERLSRSFDRWWPLLSDALDAIPREVSPARSKPKDPEGRPIDDKIDELLLLMRAANRESSERMSREYVRRGLTSSQKMLARRALSRLPEELITQASDVTIDGETLRVALTDKADPELLIRLKEIAREAGLKLQIAYR